MFKNKTIKLFLILGVILFSLLGVVGCCYLANYLRFNYSNYLSQIYICNNA